MIPSLGGVLAVVVVVIAAIVCGRVPLLSNAGPESGMVLAIVGGVAIALAGAARGARKDGDGYSADFRAGLIIAAISFVVFVIATAIGAAMTPSCSASAGRLPMAITAIPPMVLQAALGPFIGRLVGRRKLAVVAVIAIELVIVGSIAADLYAAPGFRVASHFFVVITSDLLAGAALPQAAIAFHVVTLVLAGAIAGAGGGLWPVRKARGLVSGATADTAGSWAVAVVCAVTFVFAHAYARAALMPDRDAIEAQYSLVKKRQNLVVHADPLATTPREVDGLLAEGVMWLERLENRLGPLSKDEIHLWAHHDRAAMAAATGAQNVDFALPWRRELHIGSTGVPHRTLGHELAHVVVGERNQTILRVPSRFVVFNNAAVTEGVAMALTPELVVNDGLTLQEQAAAMRQSGRAPSLSALFSFMSFFRESPSRAYVAAGALIEAIVADGEGAGSDGPGAIARLYAGSGSLDAVSADVDGLLASHEARLMELPLPKDAAAFAAARFSRPSVLDEVCDEDVAKAGEALRRTVRLGDVDGAIAQGREVFGDNADGTLSSLLPDIHAIGDEGGAIALLRVLVSLSPTPAEKAMRELALGVQLWRAGQEREAQVVFDAIDDEVAVVDVQRQIIATRAFASAAVRLRGRAPISRAALGFFVADGAERDGARLAFAAAVGAGSADEPDDTIALAHYVLGRQFVQQGSLDEGIAMLRPLVGTTRLAPVFDEQATLALGVALVRRASQRGHVEDHTSDTPPPSDAAAVPPPGDVVVDGRVGADAVPAPPPRQTDAQEAARILADAAKRAVRPASRLFLRDRADRASRAAQAPPPPLNTTPDSDPAWGDRLLLGEEAAGGF
jgi:hypothetical protein